MITFSLSLSLHIFWSEVNVPGPAKVLFNGPLKTLKRQTQMCVRAQGQPRLTDLKQEEGCKGMLEDKTAARRKVEE